jgi:hypothetical protein
MIVTVQCGSCAKNTIDVRVESLSLAQASTMKECALIAILANFRCCEEAVRDWRRHSVPLVKRHSQLNGFLSDVAEGNDSFADIFSVGCSVLEYASLVVLGSWDDPSEGGELLYSTLSSNLPLWRTQRIWRTFPSKDIVAHQAFNITAHSTQAALSYKSTRTTL